MRQDGSACSYCRRPAGTRAPAGRGEQRKPGRQGSFPVLKHRRRHPPVSLWEVLVDACLTDPIRYFATLCLLAGLAFFGAGALLVGDGELLDSADFSEGAKFMWPALGLLALSFFLGLASRARRRR